MNIASKVVIATIRQLKAVAQNLGTPWLSIPTDLVMLRKGHLNGCA